ncbi:MAG: hypothetical protein EPN88_05745 [Bacteroidetes bacterium]|nr:MAG: hypothetical protein EPN88_05745 [Bacteroidota bacterium]
MTNEKNFEDLKDNLEKETLVVIQRIKSIGLSLKSTNENLKLIHKLLDTNLTINPSINKIDILKLKEDIIEKKEEVARMKKDSPEITRVTELITTLEETVKNPIFIKNRNKLEDSPERLWFKMYGIYFYIEFTIRSSKKDEKSLEGCFIYGTSYLIEKDKVEDNPIISFSIDGHKIITANNDFEDEEWICEEENLIDLHLRTLDKIWAEALFVINKDKF